MSQSIACSAILCIRARTPLGSGRVARVGPTRPHAQTGARSGVPREALNSLTPPQRPLMEKAAADLKKEPRGSHAKRFAKLAALFGTACWAPRRVEGDAEVGEETDRDTQKGRPKESPQATKAEPHHHNTALNSHALHGPAEAAVGGRPGGHTPARREGVHCDAHGAQTRHSAPV